MKASTLIDSNLYNDLPTKYAFRINSTLDCVVYGYNYSVSLDVFVVFFQKKILIILLNFLKLVLSTIK